MNCSRVIVLPGSSPAMLDKRPQRLDNRLERSRETNHTQNRLAWHSGQYGGLLRMSG